MGVIDTDLSVVAGQPAPDWHDNYYWWEEGDVIECRAEALSGYRSGCNLCLRVQVSSVEAGKNVSFEWSGTFNDEAVSGSEEYDAGSSDTFDWVLATAGVLGGKSLAATDGLTVELKRVAAAAPELTVDAALNVVGFSYVSSESQESRLDRMVASVRLMTGLSEETLLPDQTILRAVDHALMSIAHMGAFSFEYGCTLSSGEYEVDLSGLTDGGLFVRAVTVSNEVGVVSRLRRSPLAGRAAVSVSRYDTERGVPVIWGQAGYTLHVLPPADGEYHMVVGYETDPVFLGDEVVLSCDAAWDYYLSILAALDILGSGTAFSGRESLFARLLADERAERGRLAGRRIPVLSRLSNAIL